MGHYPSQFTEILVVDMTYLIYVKFIHGLFNSLEVVNTHNPGEAGNESSITFR